MPGFKQSIGQSLATTTSAGLMSAADKAELDLITSGTWTPTCTITTNLASVTPSVGQYLRVGSVVHCSVRVTIDPTSTGVTRFRATLPIASALANVGELTGGAFNINAGPNQIFADTANDEADIQSVASITSAYDLACVFSYRVI